MALVAGFAIGLQVFAVDGFCQNAGAGGFAHTSWPTKKKRMRQVIALNGILKGRCDMLLAYNRIKGLRAVFTGRNNEFIHEKHRPDNKHPNRANVMISGAAESTKYTHLR